MEGQKRSKSLKGSVFARLVSGLVLAFGINVSLHAAPATGIPVGNTFGWVPNSTNALNFAQLVPGREGQSVPYVLFNTNAFGSVTLDFFNIAPGLAFFETRIDGVATGATPHPVVIGDTIHGGGTGVPGGTTTLGKVFLATQFVDIRLALGAERDWDFDWVRFEVPAPGVLSLFAVGLLGLGFSRRRQAS